MAKGSGLSIDPDRIGLLLFPPILIPTVTNSFSDHHHRTGKLEPPMDHPTRSSPPTIQFPVNLRCTHDQDHRTAPPPSAAFDDGKRTEMDFFADKKDNGVTTTDDADNKDLSVPTELNFNVNTGLHLLTANTSSDQSIVDDEISANSEDKRAKSERAVLQAELERMNTENQRLTGMLNQVTSNYNALQMHLVTQMQQQKDHRAAITEEHHDAMKLEDRSHINGDGGLMVPRRFMDLALASTAETEEPSLSSSDGDRDRSPPVINNGVAPSKEYSNGEDSADQGSQVWGPNKVPRLSPQKSIDQATEATIRKARVSVRARSEAPMV